MKKYIDAEKLAKAIEDKGLNCSFALKMERLDTLALIDELREEQPSLPSNLDEAAKEIAYSVCRQLPNGEEKDNIVYYAILAAKAGAEWMAEQGYTTEEKVDRTPLNGPPGIYLNLHEYDGFKDGFKLGDRVIVQIQKKK